MNFQPIQKTFYKVADFISWQKARQLILAPNFQRRQVWTPGAKSFLLDTIVRGLPIPIIFLRDKRTDPNVFEPVREVVDGQQRLRALISFIAPQYLLDYNPDRDDFTIKKTHNSEIYGKPFSELPDEFKQSILDYEFNVHVLPSSMDDREIIQIFRRMNSTNFTLNKQEIRNALFFGEFKTSAYQLAAEQLMRWRNWGTFSEDSIARMQEVEHTAECMMMIQKGRISGKSPARIDMAFKDNDERFPFRTEVEKRFRAIMGTIDEHFGDDREFVFFKKTLLYTFFALLYHLQYRSRKHDLRHFSPKAITKEHVARLKTVSNQIATRRAPLKVLQSTDRRTTNPKERNTLLTYLIGTVR